MLQVFCNRIILAECRPFARMGHQSDAGDDGIQFVVALKASASAAEDPNAIVRTNLREWKIDLVLDAQLIKTQAKVYEYFLHSARHRGPANNPASNRPHEAIALDPAIALGLVFIVEAQPTHP